MLIVRTTAKTVQPDPIIVLFVTMEDTWLENPVKNATQLVPPVPNFTQNV